MIRRTTTLAGLCVLTGVWAQAQDFPSIAQATLDSTVTAARLYLDLPERETLSQSELDAAFTGWDESIQSRTIMDRCRALRPFSQGAHLRYDNPEVEQRIVDLFLSEKDDFARRARGGPASWEEIDAPGEVEQDYMDLLEPLAYETFSPRIYDVALAWYGGGGFLRNVYLACVNPETTLRLLLESRRRERERLSQGAGWLDHPTGQACFHSLEEGLLVLALLCQFSPEIVQAERERVRDFVQEHATFYRDPIKVGKNDEPKRSMRRDLETRHRALCILEFIGNPEDVPLIQDIMRDPPFTKWQFENLKTVSEVTIRGDQLLRRLRDGS